MNCLNSVRPYIVCAAAKQPGTHNRPRLFIIVARQRTPGKRSLGAFSRSRAVLKASRTLYKGQETRFSLTTRFLLTGSQTDLLPHARSTTTRKGEAAPLRSGRTTTPQDQDNKRWRSPTETLTDQFAPFLPPGAEQARSLPSLISHSGVTALLCPPF